MNTASANTTNLLKECRTVAENCLYNAQAHFALAASREKQVRWLILVPSIITSVCGVLTALGLPRWIGVLSAGGGLVVSIATSLGVEKGPAVHKKAAALWTALRHEARSLCETYFAELTRDQLLAEVRRIDDRYNSLCNALETTDRSSFEAARQRIKLGEHELDFKRREE